MEVVALKQYQKYIMSSNMFCEFSQSLSLGIRKKDTCDVFHHSRDKFVKGIQAYLHMNAEKLNH